MSGGVSSCIEVERRNLLDVKANLTDPRGHLNEWGSEEEKMDCCKWRGVTCDDRTGHVVKLDLYAFPDFSFAGKISPSLQVLSRLQYLSMSDIDFQSNPLPNFLGSLSNLHILHICSANLSGRIPHQLANLSNLLELDLSNNSLEGSIPFALGDLTSLTYLYLSRNQLGGVIPNSLGNCSSLAYLDLSQNQLGGVIPKSVGNCSSLEYLNLSQTLLNGSLPSFVGCSFLFSLSVANNYLNGNIPDLTGCPSLSFLDMSDNQFLGNVPNSLGQLSNLEQLDLSSNSLEGVISEVHFLNLTKFLDLSLNSLALDLRFHWKIPFQLFFIQLQSCKLGPKFPMWIITQKNIQYLDISNTGISDNIPQWFSSLSSWLNFMNLSSNEIKGIPPDMSNIGSSGLDYNERLGMDLSYNQFEGKVPLLPPKVAALNLAGNRFSGTLSFLCEIGEVLTFLDLSNNSFSGSLPDCWLKFQKTLVVLNLSNNNLCGKIPSSLGFLSSLEALYLRTNAFIGEVPMSLCKCTKLRFLDLWGNKLSGILPKWIGEELSELYVLVLGSNRFHGRLSSQVCWLHNLQVLDLSNNGLSGNIPGCFGNFTAMARKSFINDMNKHSYSSSIGTLFESLQCGPNVVCSAGKTEFIDNAWVTWKGCERSFGRSALQLLKSIDLSRNNLSGTVPDEITRLYELVSLNLSFNRLNGEVPKDIGQLKYMESLDLSRNEFFGHIPSSLAQINSLSYLDLSNNNLLGRIPTGPQLQLFNDTSYIGNPQLCGPPLTPRCGILPVGEKKKAIEEDEDDSWKSYYTGMGAGFAVGFLGICGALIINRRCRYILFVSLSYIKDWIYVTAVVYFRKLERKFRR